MRTTLTLDDDVAAKLKTESQRAGRPFSRDRQRGTAKANIESVEYQRQQAQKQAETARIKAEGDANAVREQAKGAADARLCRRRRKPRRSHCRARPRRRPSGLRPMR